MANERYWFAPKRIGYGSGPPIAWQGWVVYAALFLSFFLDALLAPPPWRFYGFAILAVGFGVICWRKTEGGWRWRP